MAKGRTAADEGRLASEPPPRMAHAAKNEPRKRPQQARSQKTVDLLLEATARVLARDGFDGATTREIARVAGVSIGSLYQYFPSKEALVAALLDRRTRADVEQVFAASAAAGEVSLVDRLRVSTGAAVALYRKDLPLYRALLQNVPRVGRADTLRAAAQQGREGMKALIEAHRAELRDVDPELGAFVLTSAIEWVLLSAVIEHPERLDDPRLVDEVVTLAVGYLSRI